MATLELNTTTEFLVVAATLVEIKALRLLPGGDEDELDDVAIRARDLLRPTAGIRMVRDAAVFLVDQMDRHTGMMARQVPLEDSYRSLHPPTRIGMDLDALGRLAYTVCTPTQTEIDTTHIRARTMRVHDAAVIVLDWLQRGPTLLRTIIEDCANTGEIVAHFLAILELYKLDWLTIADHADGLMITRDPNANARPLPALVELS